MSESGVRDALRADSRPRIRQRAVFTGPPVKGRADRRVGCADATP
jgi:hypothetical protein